MPSSVTSSVCSNCADRLPSVVTTVQLSGHCVSFGFPAFTIGSIVNTIPGRIFPFPWLSALNPSNQPYYACVESLGCSGTACRFRGRSSCGPRSIRTRPQHRSRTCQCHAHSCSALLRRMQRFNTYASRSRFGDSHRHIAPIAHSHRIPFPQRRSHSGLRDIPCSRPSRPDSQYLRPAACGNRECRDIPPRSQS